MRHQAYRISLILRKGLGMVKDLTIVGYADAAFANVENVKSQYGQAGGLAASPAAVEKCDYSRVLPLWWHSGTVKRVVRSTLAAEGYGVSEVMEMGIYLRNLLSEIHTSPGSLRLKNGFKELTLPVACFSESNSLVTSISKDAGHSSDKRLAIVLGMLREVVGGGEPCVTSKWVPTWRMMADALTKLGISPALLVAFFGAAKANPAPTKAKAVCLLALLRAASAAEVTLEPGAGQCSAGGYLFEDLIVVAVFVAFFVAFLTCCLGWACCWRHTAEAATRRGRGPRRLQDEPAEEPEPAVAPPAAAPAASADPPAPPAAAERTERRRHRGEGALAPPAGAAQPLLAGHMAEHIYITRAGECFHMVEACRGLNGMPTSRRRPCRMCCHP